MSQQLTATQQVLATKSENRLMDKFFKCSGFGHLSPKCSGKGFDTGKGRALCDHCLDYKKRSYP
jgi:hypothetical protein